MVGGGYRSRSNLLRTVTSEVNHYIRGDRRQFIVTNPEAVKISPKNRQRIVEVYIYLFINRLS
ncbi:MAG: P-loop domain-containing protein [cyanobacterium endosymbiont of Rhopalodia sterrenbergii]